MAPSNGWSGALRSVTAGGAVCRVIVPRSLIEAHSIRNPQPATGNLFVVVFRPEARVLVQERERLERLHPIEEQHAIQVVVLVLDDARRKLFELHVEGLAVAIEATHAHATVARHLAADVRDAQAALPVLDEIAADGGDLGVYDGVRDNLGLAGAR